MVLLIELFLIGTNKDSINFKIIKKKETIQVRKKKIDDKESWFSFNPLADLKFETLGGIHTTSSMLTKFKKNKPWTSCSMLGLSLVRSFWI